MLNYILEVDDHIPLLEVRKTVFDDALALEMMVGKETW